MRKNNISAKVITFNSSWLDSHNHYSCLKIIKGALYTVNEKSWAHITVILFVAAVAFWGKLLVTEVCCLRFSISQLLFLKALSLIMPRLSSGNLWGTNHRVWRPGYLRCMWKAARWEWIRHDEVLPSKTVPCLLRMEIQQKNKQMLVTFTDDWLVHAQ